MFGESSECVGVCVWMLSMWSHGSWGTLSVSPVCGMPVMLKCVCVCEGQYWGVWSLCVSGLPGDHGIFSCVSEQGTHTWRDPDAHWQRFWF